jgi:hypothetical protein
MNAHDIDRGVPPQTHGSGRRRSSIRSWGPANPPRPHPKGRGGSGLAQGGARSGMTRASPPAGRPGPHPGLACARRRGVRAPRARPGRMPLPCPQQRAAALRVGRPGVAALRAVPPTGGGDLRSLEGGRGPRFGSCPPFVRPALPHLWAGPPNFGANVVYIASPAQRSEKTIGAA